MEQESLQPSLDESSNSKPETSINRRGARTTNLIADHGGAPRRRAAQACCSCGKRKVRCDVGTHGAPCSNCKFNNVPCVLPEKARKRRRQLDHNGDDEAPGFSTTSDMGTSVYKLNTGPSTERESALDGMLDLNPVPLMPSYGAQESHRIPHSISQGQNQQNDSPGIGNGNTLKHFSQRLPIPEADLSFLDGILDGTAGFLDPRSTNILPSFVKPPPDNINDDDIEYLGRRGALSVPDLPLRKKLLHSYIEHVHFQMPVLELGHFLQVVDTDDGKMGQVSLLLFQCVMFAAASFVDLQYLQDAGFPTRFAARKALFLKTRALYDLDYEKEQITLVQSLLLMTLWYDTPDDQKDMWYWGGVTASLSLATGLHNPAGPNVDYKTRRLWKRIGWACFVRDQLVALGTQRPTRIKDTDHNLPMLTMEDFDLEPLSWNVSSMGTDCELVRDAAKLRKLAALNIEMAKLSLCFSRVLATQYTVLQRKPGGEGSDSSGVTNNFLSPRVEDTGGTKEVQDRIEELDAWRSQCPEETRYPGCLTSAPEAGEIGITIYRAMLDMLYYSTVITLLGPQSFKQNTTNSDSAQTYTDSHSKVQQAAMEVTNIAQDLLRFNIINFIPGYGVSVLISAVMTHMRNMRSSILRVKNPSIQGFKKCMEVLQSVRCIHPGANVLINIIEYAMGKKDPSGHANEPGNSNMSEPTGHTPSGQEKVFQWKDFELPAGKEQQLHPSGASGSGLPRGEAEKIKNPNQDRTGNAFDANRERLPKGFMSRDDENESIDPAAIYFGSSNEVAGYFNGDISTEWAEYMAESRPLNAVKHEHAPMANPSFEGLLEEVEDLWTKLG